MWFKSDKNGLNFAQSRFYVQVAFIKVGGGNAFIFHELHNKESESDKSQINETDRHSSIKHSSKKVATNANDI